MKTTTSRIAPLLFAGAVTSSLMFAAVGCGSGGGTSPTPGLPLLSAAASSAASFAGRSYASQIALANGEIGNLSLTTAASNGNTASGTLQIVDPTRGTKSRLVIATPFLSGTFDPATGAINLTGSYTVNGQTIPIRIVGTLPPPPSTTGGSLTTTIGGQSYTSTFGGTTGTNPTPSPSASASPSPSPSASPTPSPSASASPSPNPSPSAPPVTVTGQRFVGTISAQTADYSGASSAILASELASSVFVNTSALVTPTFTQKRTGGTGETTVQFTLGTPGASATAPIAPGTYPIGQTSGIFATAFYNEGAANGWKAVSGDIIVDTVAGDVMTFRFVNVRMMFSRSFGSTTAQGSFTLNGSGNARVSCLTAATCQ